MDISKKCDQQCPSRSTENYIAISSCDAEGCPKSMDYSTVCDMQLKYHFKDLCEDGKDCLMANNSNIAYQQCFTGDPGFLRYYFDRKLCFHVVFDLANLLDLQRS